MKTITTTLLGLLFSAAGGASESMLPPVRDGMSVPVQPKVELKRAETKVEAKITASKIAISKSASSKPVLSRPVYESAGSLAPEDSDLYSVYSQN